VRQEHLRLLATGVTASGHCLLEVDCTPLAQPARAGQYLMLRTDVGYGEALRRPTFFSRGGRTGQLLFPQQESWQRSLAQIRPEETLDAIGPLGQPFSPRPGASRLLVLALCEPIAPALAAAQWAVRQGCTVSVLLGNGAWDSLAGLIPDSIECSVMPAGGWRALEPSLHWADQVIAVMPAAELYPLSSAIISARMRLVPGFAGVLLPSDYACGAGACGACSIRTRSGRVCLCVDGPILDLPQLL
jgi:hypothetical protein